MQALRYIGDASFSEFRIPKIASFLICFQIEERVLRPYFRENLITNLMRNLTIFFYYRCHSYFCFVATSHSPSFIYFSKTHISLLPFPNINGKKASNYFLPLFTCHLTLDTFPLRLTGIQTPHFSPSLLCNFRRSLLEAKIF